MIKYILDTNIVIYTMKNRPEKVRRAVNLHAGQLCISSITYSELVYGAERSSHTEQNLHDIEEFAANLEVISFDTQDATHGGEVRSDLAECGQTIGAYDALIAGHARSKGLVLVTNNMKEFLRVPGLRVENWAR